MKDWQFALIILFGLLGLISLPFGLFVLFFYNNLEFSLILFAIAIISLGICGMLDTLYDDYDYDVCKSVSASTKYDKEEEKTIVIKQTHCASCGAPLEDDVCSYCGTKSVIYKRIKPNSYLIDNTEAINYIV